MQPIYEHRQPGTAVLWLVGIPALGIVLLILTSGSPGAMLPLLVIPAFLLLVMFLFSSLTVRVDESCVRIHFGPGFWRRAFPLDQVEGVRVVRNGLHMGLGIHFIRRGMIYNVSGLDGVEITLRGGRRARIGSDEPAALARAVEAALLSRPAQECRAG